jgi:CheY-like chemotaxis protein
MQLKEITVLYVEDNLETQRLIKRILDKKCKEVYVANDGLQGLALYEEKRPDIVISDIVMPNLNGIEMSEKIRKINPKQIISLFTAYTEPEFQEKANELKIDAYILKPFDEKQFFNSLNYLAMAYHTDLENREEKKFKIGASHTIGSYVLPGEIIESIREEVNQKIKLTLSSCDEIVHAVKMGKLDLGFIEFPHFDESLVFKEWREDELVVCSKTELPRAIGEKEFNHYRIISREKGSAKRDFVEAFLRGEGLSYYDFESITEVDKPTAIIENVKWAKPRSSSATVAIVSKVSIEHELKYNTLYSARIHGKPLMRKFYIVYKETLLNKFKFSFLGLA